MFSLHFIVIKKTLVNVFYINRDVKLVGILTKIAHKYLLRQKEKEAGGRRKVRPTGTPTPDVDAPTGYFHLINYYAFYSSETLTRK